MVGYNVEAHCDSPNCMRRIDRGLSYACGEMHGETEYGCEGYFCEEHRTVPDLEDYDGPFVCHECAKALELAEEADGSQG